MFTFVHMHAFICKEQYHECVCPSVCVGVKLHAISNIMYLCMCMSVCNSDTLVSSDRLVACYH